MSDIATGNNDSSSSGIQSLNEELVRKLGGDSFDRMWQSRSATLVLLGHEQSSVRAAALICGNCRWRMSDEVEYVKACVAIACSDDNLSTRRIAITQLAECFFATHDAGIEQHLVRIVYDDGLPIVLRNHAYRALRRVAFGFEATIVEEAIAEGRSEMQGETVCIAIDWDFIATLRSNPA